MRRAILLTAALALPAAAPALAAPTITEFDIPTADSGPWDITQGPDGNLWFLERTKSRIGRVVPTATPQITDYPTKDAVAPQGITVGPDGKVWYTEPSVNKVARFTPGDPPSNHESFGGLGLISGQGLATGPDGDIWVVDSGTDQIVRVKPSDGLPTDPIALTPGFGGRNIAQGADGNMWVTGFGSEKIARITPGAPPTVTYFTLPTGHTPWDIAAGPDNNLWYTAQATRVGRITTDGTISPFTSVGTDPFGITVGPDGALWYAEFASNTIGRVDISGATSQVTGMGSNAGPRFIANGPNQDLWFTEETANKIGRVTGIELPQSPPPPPLTDMTAPDVTGFRITRRVFRAGGLGTVLSFTLSEDAVVTIVFDRRVRGRWVRVKRKMTFQSTAGSIRFRFRGRFTIKRPLRPGRYRMTFTAKDAAGNVSTPDRARFRLLPPRRPRR